MHLDEQATAYRVAPLGPVESWACARPSWDDLARGAPFRSFAWLSTWWRHYGAGHELLTLGVYDRAERLVGIAPWYLETSAAEGRVIRPLGTGEVCSDYLSILCDADGEQETRVATALAEWLTSDAAPEWDLLHLDAVDQDDTAIARLAAALAALGCKTHQQETFRCWRLALPESWDEFLMMQSKSHRKQLRRLEKRGMEQFHARLVPANEANFQQAWQILIDLHQRRRVSLGEPGCFASPRFAQFHRDAAEQFLAAGQLRLFWLELDGLPVAAEYQLAGEGVTYAYQAGVDPDRLDAEPGRLIMIATIRAAIDAGQQGFDYLRGDEPYKVHWRAEPRQAYSWRVAANSPQARLRHKLWLTTGNVKGWLKGARSLVAGSEA